MNLAHDRELLLAVTSAAMYVNLGCDVLAAVNMKILIFRDVMPCNLLRKYHFLWNLLPPLHGRRREQ
jgi:hypothetical protein